MVDRGQVLVLVSVFSILHFLALADNEKGFPFVKNYTHSDLHASSMNYGISRDSLGVFYAANEDGVLVYDGYEWELVPIANNKQVYWVEVGHDNVPYVASSSEFGYLSADGGELKYVSLSSKIDSAYHDFEVVWEVGKTSREVVFRSKKYLFVLRDGSLSVLRSEARGFDVLYPVRDTLYVRDRGRGLCKLVGDKLELMTGGEFYADMKLNIYLPYKKDQILIGTRKKGIFINDSGQNYPLETEADSIFVEHNIYHGCVTQDGNFAFASSTSGVVVINESGELLQFFGPDIGLPDNQILSVSALDEENLWMATGRGISRVGMQGPLTHVNYSFGLKDKVTDILRFQDQLYISTLYGLFKISDKSPSHAIQVNKRSYQEISSLDAKGDVLLLGAQSGLFSFNGENFERIVKHRETREIRVSQDGSMIFAAIGEGHFGVYYQVSDNYQLVELEGFIEPITKIIELDGHLALATAFGNLHLVRLSWQQDQLMLKKTVSYELGTFDMVKNRGELLVFSGDEYFKLQTDGRIHSRIPLNFLDKIERIDQVSEVENDEIWVCYENDQRINYCELVSLQEGAVGSKNFKFRSDFRITTVYRDSNDVSWFGGAGGLLRYDIDDVYVKDKSIVAHIKKVEDGKGLGLYHISNPVSALKLAENQGSLKFTCFTNQTGQSHEVQFQYRLDGDNDLWSSWTTEPTKFYSHLPFGKYVFQVRSKNQYNQISEPAALVFEIETPYYKTFYAYFFYFFVLMIVIYIAFGWGIQSMTNAKKRLEEKIHERTMELVEQKQVLDQANKTKDQLFSIIGHDLRSPLNSLHSLTELIQHYQNEMNPTKVDELMKGMSESVVNLRNLLDNLLSWTLNQSGNFELRATAIELKPFVEDIVKMLRDSADKKGITINMNLNINATFIGDRNTLAVIVRNLLSNAIKFTRPDGAIEIFAKTNVLGLEMKVIDNGVGISNDKLESIFELSKSSYGTAYEKGTGIGLTLVRDFVHLNKGEVKVESKLDLGSTFSFFLPMMES